MSGTEYPKIETLFNRGSDFKVRPENGYRLPEFGLINDWLITEKVDGTNIRIDYMPPDMFAPEPTFMVRGRTDKAEVPKRLIEAIEKLVIVEQLADKFGSEHTILYGEGYGPGIQNGGWYRSDPSFRLFDVRVGDWWLNWENVEEIAWALGIKTVPLISEATEIDNVVASFQHDFSRGQRYSTSTVAQDENDGSLHPPEGIVARTNPLLFDRRGDRLMWKLKHKDFG